VVVKTALFFIFVVVKTGQNRGFTDCVPILLGEGVAFQFSRLRPSSVPNIFEIDVHYSFVLC
jgi:hypothetical protein